MPTYANNLKKSASQKLLVECQNVHLIVEVRLCVCVCVNLCALVGAVNGVVLRCDLCLVLCVCVVC